MWGRFLQITGLVLIFIFQLNNSILNAKPIAAFKINQLSDFRIKLIDHSVVTPGHIKNYIWDFNDGTFSRVKDPVHIFFKPGVYNVQLIVEDYRGEKDTVAERIIIDRFDFEKELFFNSGVSNVNHRAKIKAKRPVESDNNDSSSYRRINNLKVPNAFTPNNDGINDRWELISDRNEKLRIDIFNRWGTRVFSATSEHISWDGNKDGTQLPEGVYLYVLYFNEGTEAINGTITLLK